MGLSGLVGPFGVIDVLADDTLNRAETADVFEVRATNGNSSLEPNNDNQPSTRPGLSDLAFSDEIRRALEVEGFFSIEDLLCLCLCRSKNCSMSRVSGFPASKP